MVIMADKKFVGTFQTESQVLNKIDDLKVQGYSEDDIYVVTNDADSLSIVRGRTDVDLESVKGSWMDRFMAFLNGDEPVQAAFTDMGFTEEESSRYYTEVKNGNILMYVDQDDRHFIHERESDFISGNPDPNLGSNLTVNPVDGVYEESVNVDNEYAQAEEVNVGRHIVEDEQIFEAPVLEEEATFEERAALDETAAGEVREDEQNMRIPTMDEVVNKPPQTERLKYDSQTERDLL